MPKTFAIRGVEIKGGDFALDAGKGLWKPISKSTVPTFKAFSIAQYDSTNDLIIDPTFPGANSNLVLALEDASDPYYEAEHADDRKKSGVNILRLGGGLFIMSTGGAAFAAANVGQNFRLAKDATTGLTFVDLSSGTNAAVKIVDMVDEYLEYTEAAGTFSSLPQIRWAKPDVGDTGVRVMVEFLSTVVY